MRVMIPLLFVVGCGSAAPTPEPTASEHGSVPRLTEPETPAGTSGSSTPAAAPSGTTTPAPKPADPYASTLTVYAIHAPTSTLNQSGLAWTSPGGLTRQVLYNGAGAVVAGFSHTIGHAFVKVDCAADGTHPAVQFAGGMTSATDDSMRSLVVNDGVGLGIMFESVPGHMQTAAEVQVDIDAAIAGDLPMNYVRFGVASSTCQRLVEYATAFHAEGVDGQYGLAVRPLHKEGSGCSAFAVSFMQLANLVDTAMKGAWMFHVRVPMYTDPLIGSPEPLIGGTRNPGVSVPVTRVASLTRDWATPQEDGIDIEGWDPTQMNEWIENAIAKAAAADVEAQGKLRGIKMDRTSVTPTPELANGTFWSP